MISGRPNGIILVTGPTGSGKTTTLYSDAQAAGDAGGERLHHRRPDRDGGAGVQPDAGASGHRPGFAEGVRALMRQDPDIIMVGEIRDLETAEMAIQAALTGHLVLSTLHTNDAPSAITRMLDLGALAYLLNATPAGHHGPAAGAHAVPPLQGGPTRRPRRGGDLGSPGGAPGRSFARRASTGRWAVHGMPDDRLHGAHRAVRDPADVAGGAQVASADLDLAGCAIWRSAKGCAAASFRRG